MSDSEPVPVTDDDQDQTGTAPDGDDLTPEEVEAIRASQAHPDTPDADDKSVG